MKLIEACKAFWSTLTGSEPHKPEIEEKVEPKVEEKPQEPPKPEVDVAGISKKKFEDGVVYGLTLLQREGRLIDFLKENIDAYDDSQVGAAVRQIHAECGKCLDDHVKLVPVMNDSEGASVSVAKDYDPSEMKLTGNVPDSAPYNGTLNHKGWKVTGLDLPQVSDKMNFRVVQPADIGF